MYQLIVGEIGIPRHDFLYNLQVWEVRRIIRGYRKREQTTWEQCRWQTFWLLHNGMLDVRKAGINQPSDLIQFPWDKEQVDPDMPTKEEVDAMRQELIRLNEETDRKKKLAKQASENARETKP